MPEPTDRDREIAADIDDRNWYPRRGRSAAIRRDIVSALAAARAEGEAAGRRKGLEEAAAIAEAEHQRMWSTAIGREACGKPNIVPLSKADAADRIAAAIRSLASREEKDQSDE